MRNPSLFRFADHVSLTQRRHQQTLVLYDPRSRQIILREASPPATVEPVLPTCPLCKRPLHDETESDSSGPSTGSHRTSPLAESGFVDQDYFRMLESSVPIGQSPITAPRRAPPRHIPRLKSDNNVEITDGSDDELSEQEYEGSSGPPRESRKEDRINATAFSAGYFERFFVTERELGRGGKGVVLLVKHVLDGVTLGNFACKRVPVGDNHEWLEKVLLEVQLLQRLSHQNLISYRHVWLEDMQLTTFGPSVPCAFILQQYCNSGDLHNYIVQSPGVNPRLQSVTEQLKERLRRRNRGEQEPTDQVWRPRKVPFDQILCFFRDIASGLNHLHSNGFIHRDLKPSNCLLHDTGQGLKVLVSDFGEVQQEDQMRKSSGTTGTISYCAPEVLRKVTPDGPYHNFTTKSDVFSLGMILHFICFGRLPYVGADALNEENEDVASLREEITTWRGLDEALKIRTDLPEKLYHSLKTLISPDQSVRPSASDILLGIDAWMGLESPGPPRGRGSPKNTNNPDAEILCDTSQVLGFRRISPIADTPRPGTPANGTTSQKERAASEPLITTASRRKSLLYEELRAPEAPPTPNSEAGSGSEMENSVILRRPRAASPAPPMLVQREPLEPLWVQMSSNPRAVLLVRVMVYFVKLSMLTQPCLPAAVKTSIFYPMVALATLDFLAPLNFLWMMALAGLHGILMIYLMPEGKMCMY